MTPSDLLAGLPGEALIRQGLLDVAEGRETIPACLVAIGSPRLERAGLITSELARSAPPEGELRLYRRLRSEGRDAYSDYNGLIRQLISFEQALDHRCARLPE